MLESSIPNAYSFLQLFLQVKGEGGDGLVGERQPAEDDNMFFLGGGEEALGVGRRKRKQVQIQERDAEKLKKRIFPNCRRDGDVKEEKVLSRKARKKTTKNVM